MHAQARTFTIEGLHARPVGVEVDIRPGLPSFAIVGLAGAAVREARERVRAAILNCGLRLPSRRITANLAPGDLPKSGPGLDLAIAVAILAASEQLHPAALSDHALLGELALDGRLRPCRGTLAVAQACVHAGLKKLVLAPESAPEAALVAGLQVAPARSLTAAVRILRGGEADPLPQRNAVSGRAAKRASDEPDLSEVRGQEQAIESLLIAAAGAHNALMVGPPGTGKTMLAQRLPTILPPLSRSEAIEVTRIHSLTGASTGEMASRRPFRSPHHSITLAGMIGGARADRLGEVVLAHRGVLFLDELSEFQRQVLDALRQPLEDGRVTIVRASRSDVQPARFMLLAASNPCPCGYAGDGDRCRCEDADHARHRRRLSGPLLDRIDLLIQMSAQAKPFGAPGSSIDSTQARSQVLTARQMQAQRLRGERTVLNAELDDAALRRFATPDIDGQRLLERACDAGQLSARGVQRTLRLARTIADLHRSEKVRSAHVAQALQLRPGRQVGAEIRADVA